MNFCMNLPKQIGIPNVERVPLLILVKVFKQQVIIVLKLTTIANFHTYMQEMV